MAINSVRTALQLVTGAGELTRAKALEAAAVLAELPGVGETTTRVSQLADELFDAATANQQLVENLVRTEVDRQLERVGLARAADLEEARRKIDALESQVAALREQVAGAGGSSGAAPRAESDTKPVSRAAVKKVARQTPPASSGNRTTAKKTAAKKATKKTAAKKAAAKKAAAKKAAAKKAAKKSADRRQP